MSAIAAFFRRDVAISLRSGAGSGQTVAFFALVALLFAFAVGPERGELARLAAPIVWTCALLAAILTLDRILHADFEDGSLDVMVETASFLELAVLAKAAAHWTTTCLPLLAAAPLIALALDLPASGYGPLLLSLAIGTPALSLTGAFAAAVTLTLQRAGVLAAILAAPLYAPTLIFGVGAAQAGLEGRPDFLPNLLLLAAATLFSVIIAPLAGAAAIRFNMQ